MNIFFTQLMDLHLEKSLRVDYLFNNYRVNYNSNNSEYYNFSDLFQITSDKFEYSILDGDFEYCQIGDVGKDEIAHPVTLNFDDRNILDESYYSKIEKGDIIAVNENDILLSFLIPQDINIRGKSLRIHKDYADYFFTNAFLRIVPRKNPVLMYYCLMSVLYQDIYSISRIRKGYTGYATIQSDDLMKARFAKRKIDLLLDSADIITPKILKLENDIRVLNKSPISESFIINEAFEHAFGFDYMAFEKLKSICSYNLDFFSFANNPDLRCSAKFHRQAGNYVLKELNRIPHKQIKHFLSEPIVLGASISPSDYDENGLYNYVSMATIKNWNFDIESASVVSDEYADAKIAKNIRKGDIIFARSGEGTIGKVALIEENIYGIFADFTMRIRLQNILPKFAYYYFRTLYFQYLIEIYKKGLGNNTNIFPIVIREFPIPDVPISEQQKIVETIEEKLQEQNDIKLKIRKLREQIDRIIEDSITE